MGKFKKIGFSKFLAVLFLIVVVILSLIYLGVSLFYLLPFGISFLRGTYITSNDLMPNYSTVFESIFTLINILTSLLVSFLLYKLTQKQSIDSYNKEIVGPATTLYFKIKFCVFWALCENIKSKKDSLINIENENIKNLFLNLEKPGINDIQECLFKVIGVIEDTEIRHMLFVLTEDISTKFILSKNYNVFYFLKNNLVDDKFQLIEKDALVWEKVSREIIDDNFESFNPKWRKLFETLYKLTQIKS